MSKKKFLAPCLTVSICLVFFMGCDNPEDSTKENEVVLTEGLVESNKQIVDLQLKVTELEETLSAFQKDTMDESNYQNIQLYNLNKIVNALPDVENKYGYIESISDNGEVIVNRVDMLSDESMPNGYLINNLEKNETFKLDSKTLYYTVEEVAPVNVSLEDFKVQIQEYPRLMIFTIIDEKVIIVSQQYLP